MKSSLASSRTRLIIFDDSSEDVTGHVLEAFGKSGALRDPDTEFAKRVASSVARARKYLTKKQHEAGPWWGRWGVNFVYGTGAVVTGLRAVSDGAQDPLIPRALEWLESVQNKDGGFGETTASYVHEPYMGKGRSTPSQTAWALLALVEGGRARSDAARRAVSYLLESFDQEKGKWTDHSVVGTGHPAIVYLEYPSYPIAFPLMALGAYLKEVRQ